MKNLVLFFLFSVFSFFISAQDREGRYLKDARSGCALWFSAYSPDDSASWSGKCKNNFAEGYGTRPGFERGKLLSTYTGNMKDGKPNGKGKLVFTDGRKLEGNFVDGELLNLKPVCLKRLYKHIISTLDSTNDYVGDNNASLLYYYILVPKEQIFGAVVLLPGTWETTEHLVSSMQQFCELAYNNNLAVIIPSINQRLTMNMNVINFLNSCFKDAIERYNIPRDKFVMGGWSMGGLFSLRYTELAYQDSSQTAIKPKAVFSVDGPVDLENLYHNFQIKLKRNPHNGESDYGIREMEKYAGGPPEKFQTKYIEFSAYSHSQDDGGNAKYLKNVPVRIYDDVDVNWWLTNRKVDMYDMNALDQSAMILTLNNSGNTKAEFINAFQKGYRLEGNRHPHSWSIADAEEGINWILGCLDQK